MSDGELDRILASLHLILRTGRSPRLADRIRDRAGVETDRSVYPLLNRVLLMQPVRLTDLAADLGVDVSTISRQVAHVEARNLVVRSRDPDDGRASRLRLTDEGRDVLRKLGAAWKGSVGDLLAEWPAEQVTVFADTLEAFALRLGELAD